MARRSGRRLPRRTSSKRSSCCFFLASISGWIPLLIYFQGLHLTRASTAGYFEMMQTLAAVCITWGFFHAALHWHQLIAGIVLMGAVTMVQRAEADVSQWSAAKSAPMYTMNETPATQTNAL